MFEHKRVDASMKGIFILKCHPANQLQKSKTPRSRAPFGISAEPPFFLPHFKFRIKATEKLGLVLSWTGG